MSKIRIGTRGSKLALAQTNKVIDLLAKNGIEAEYTIIKTTGDKITHCGL
ncbi:MAG TPA: hydroxymethylbilane synthase, partial [Methanocorpusculum sp.]|nr:hydroxymethylbilane synthase [Methanocorpusculum sp.]